MTRSSRRASFSRLMGSLLSGTEVGSASTRASARSLMGTSFTVAACTRTSSINASADPTIITFFPTLHSASGTSSSSRDRPRGGRTPISFCRFGCTPVRACSARFSAPTLASAPASSTTSSAPHFTRRLPGPGHPPPPLPDASAIGAAGPSSRCGALAGGWVQPHAPETRKGLRRSRFASGGIARVARFSQILSGI